MSGKPSRLPDDAVRLRIAVRRLDELPADPAARRRAQSEVARDLARRAAHELTGANVTDLVIGGGGTQPPTLSGVPGLDVRLSMTHDGAWVAAAVATGAQGVGIDVQSRLPRSVARIAAQRGWQRFFPAGADEAAATTRFLAMWTLWEAVVKCDGRNVLARSSPGFDALLADHEPGIERRWRRGAWWASSERLAPDTWLTVVLRDDSGRYSPP